MELSKGKVAHVDYEPLAAKRAYKESRYSREDDPTPSILFIATFNEQVYSHTLTY